MQTIAPKVYGRTALIFLIAVSALGYFVDAYDIVIFSAVREASLAELGVPPDASLATGLSLLNYQMVGLLLGGVLFGSLGDKKGRLTVLFASIFLYSTANIINAGVHSVAAYKILRFLAGLGLAGELGAGISVVSEVMAPATRGIGTMLVATFGFFGAAAAGLVGTALSWRASYLVGGLMGLVLLLLRIGLVESPIFQAMNTRPALKKSIKNAAPPAGAVVKGNFFFLFQSRERFFRYLRCVGAGMPVYFIVGFLMTGAPEFAKSLGVSPLPVAGTALLVCYLSLSAGNMFCTALSQYMRSRRRPLMIFNVLAFLAILLFLYLPAAGVMGFYLRCGFLGFGCGLWSLVVTNAAEQFGTNMRATVATTVPNFIRGALVPIAFLFDELKPVAGLLHGAAIVGISTTVIGFVSAALSRETFGRDLDVLEGTDQGTTRIGSL